MSEEINVNACSAAVQDKISELRELLHELVNHPEVVGSRECAIVVKSHITRNLGALNRNHGFKSNSPYLVRKKEGFYRQLNPDNRRTDEND